MEEKIQYQDKKLIFYKKIEKKIRLEGESGNQ